MPETLATLHTDLSSVEEFCSLLLERFPDLCECDFSHVVSNVEIGEFVPTTGANEIVRIVVSPQFDARFQCLLTALRTGDRNGFLHTLTLY